MIVEKLTIKDTFRIWRDKINALFDYFGRVPATDEEGNFIIDKESMNADMLVVNVPSLFTNTITAEKGFTGNLIGNADTATSLKNETEINGTIFKGDTDITTRKWGEERSISICDSTFEHHGDVVMVDGSNEIYQIPLPSTISASIIGSVESAKKLENIIQIDGINFDGTQNIFHYGYCTTAASERIKRVELSEYTLSVGSYVTVKFKNRNRASQPLSLNVNNTGDKPILIEGVPIDPYYIVENCVFTFVYDGTSYNLIGSDNKVYQSLSRENNNYPILATPLIGQGSSKAGTTIYSGGISINPSTDSLSVDGNIFVEKSVSVEGNVSSESVTTNTISAPNGILSIEITPKGTANVVDPSNTNTENMDDVGSETLQKSVYTRTININYNEDKESYFNDSCEINIGGDIGYVDNIYCAGDVCADKVHNALWNDYAEFFEKGEDTEAGDIIALDVSSNSEQYIKATKDSPLVIGVHSDTYGHILGGLKDGIEASKQFFIPVGLKGRVNVKFKGKSQLGEAVVPSDIPGVGCLYNSSVNTERQIIGYIVEDSSETEELRKVKIFLK